VAEAAAKGEPVTRPAALLAIVVAGAGLLSACSHDAPVSVPGDVHAEQHLRQDCANPTWKEQNLGLWYSLCRKPLSL
jgi:hypothetical protein